MKQKKFNIINKCFSVIILVLFLASFISAKYELQFRQGLESASNDLSSFDFRTASHTISWPSAFDSYLGRNQLDQLEIFYAGESIFTLSEDNSENLKRIQNTSYKSAIYSLSFLRAALQDSSIYTIRNFELNQINNLVLSLIKLSDDLFLTDTYILHDHPVAERLETLLLFLPYLTQKGGDSEVINTFQAHVHQLFRLLCHDSYFTFYMNHGLMQIRAQLAYMCLAGNPKNIPQVLERIHDIFPIYVASDGSILESATGYQLYIYNQFNIISSLLEHASKKQHSLSAQLIPIRSYLNSLITEDSFLQGVGDSYSEIVEFERTSPFRNHLFKYSNGIAGVNLRNGGDILNLLFVSLDNKPNVHKLPEDLSIYLYLNEPFFSNSGTYSYEKNDTFRNFVLSEQSQNGPKFANGVILASKIKSLDLTEAGPFFSGYALSKSDTLIRTIQIDTLQNTILIEDSSNEMLISRLLVHPNVKVRPVGENIVNLIGKNDTITLTSNVHLEIKESWVSTGYQTKKTVKSLVFSGEHIVLLLELPERIGLTNFDVKQPFDSLDTKRNFLTRSLIKKYPLSLVIKKINTSYLLGTLPIMALLLFNLTVPFSKRIKLVFSLFIIGLLFVDICSERLFVVETVYLLRSLVL